MAKDVSSKGINKFLEATYYQGLGNFIGLFSLAEAMLKKVLAKTAGVEPRIAVALFSGTRADQACSFVRRCYEANGEDLPKELDAFLAQLAVINTLRNDAVHFDADFKADPPVITNRASALTQRSLRETPITQTILRDAGYDLGWIILGLASFLVDSPAEDQLKNRADAFGRPWLHKPPGQARKGPRSRKPKPRLKPKPPPKSSRAKSRSH